MWATGPEREDIDRVRIVGGTVCYTLTLGVGDEA